MVTTNTNFLQRQRSKWDTTNSNDEDGDTTQDLDSVDTYLDFPPVPKAEVKAAGGVLKYWENCQDTRPRLARMALDFLSVLGQFATLIMLMIHFNLLCSVLSQRRASIFWRPTAGQPSATLYRLTKFQSRSRSGLVVRHTTTP